MVEGAKRRGATDLFGGAVAVVPVRARGMRRQRFRSGRSQRCGSRSGAIAAAVPGVRVHEDRGAKNSPGKSSDRSQLQQTESQAK